MLVSPEFLRFAHTQNTYQLYRLLCSRDYHSIITRCQYADPNYGTCWFKAKIFPVGTAEDVMVRAMKYTAREIAWLRLVLRCDAEERDVGETCRFEAGVQKGERKLSI